MCNVSRHGKCDGCTCHLHPPCWHCENTTEAEFENGQADVGGGGDFEDRDESATGLEERLDNTLGIDSTTHDYGRSNENSANCFGAFG